MVADLKCRYFGIIKLLVRQRLTIRTPAIGLPFSVIDLFEIHPVGFAVSNMLPGIMGQLAESFCREVSNPELVLFHERQPGTGGTQCRQFNSGRDPFNNSRIAAIDSDSNQSFSCSKHNDATLLINLQPSTLCHCFCFEGG